jgi:hypothetical protein
MRTAAGAVALAGVLAAGAAAAAPIIDQENTAAFYFNYPFGSSAYAKQAAQSFTAGVDGSLVGIALQIGRAGYDPAKGSLSVRIVNTIDGQASYGSGWFATKIPGAPGESWAGQTGQLLASFTVDADDLPLVQSQYGEVAPMSAMLALPTPIEIDAGTQYAILLETIGTGNFMWNFAYGDPYDDGRAFYRVGAGFGWTAPTLTTGLGTDDMAFRTFVEGVAAIPEPGALTLLVGGMLGLGLARRR